MYHARTGTGRPEGCAVVGAAGEIRDVGEAGGIWIGHV